MNNKAPFKLKPTALLFSIRSFCSNSVFKRPMALRGYHNFPLMQITIQYTRRFSASQPKIFNYTIFFAQHSAAGCSSGSPRRKKKYK